MEPIHVGEAGEPAVVEGVKGEWRVDPAQLDDDFEGRTALLSPFDRLDPRPDAHGGAVRLRVHARDVQAGRQAPLGLLRAADPPRRPPGREARRDRRPQGLGAARERDPRGRQVHPGDRRRACRPSSRTWPPGSTSIRSRHDRLQRSQLQRDRDLDDGRCPWRPVRHHFGITSFGVNAFTGSNVGRPDHQRARRGGGARGALRRPAGPGAVRARRQRDRRARGHVRLREARREADGVRRGARDDADRDRRRTRARRTSPTATRSGRSSTPLFQAGEYEQVADAASSCSRGIRVPGRVLQRRLRESLAGRRLTRSSTCARRSSARSASGNWPRRLGLRFDPRRAAFKELVGG